MPKKKLNIFARESSQKRAGAQSSKKDFVKDRWVAGSETPLLGTQKRQREEDSLLVEDLAGESEKTEGSRRKGKQSKKADEAKQSKSIQGAARRSRESGTDGRPQHITP